MRLLCIAPYRLANPDNGGKVSLYNEYEALCARVDDFLCLAVCTLKERGSTPVPPPFPYREVPTAWSLLLLLETVGMTSLPYFLSLRRMSSRLAGLVMRFHPDVIELSFPWLMSIRRFLPPSVKVVLQTHNVETLWYEPMVKNAFLSSFLMNRLVQTERRALERADHVVCVTEADRDWFCARWDISREKTSVFPRGYPFPSAKSGSIPSGNRKQALFLGSEIYTNQAAVRVLIRDVAPQCPEVDFIVAGHIGRWLDRSTLPANVRIAGYVEHLEGLLSECDMLVCPIAMRTGISMKIAQALAFGLRIIATPESSRGYESLAGGAVWIRAIHEFPEAIRRATRLSDGEWKEAGRYDRKSVVDRKLILYKSLVEKGATR